MEKRQNGTEFGSPVINEPAPTEHVVVRDDVDLEMDDNEQSCEAMVSDKEELDDEFEFLLDDDIKIEYPDTETPQKEQDLNTPISPGNSLTLRELILGLYIEWTKSHRSYEARDSELKNWSAICSSICDAMQLPNVIPKSLKEFNYYANILGLLPNNFCYYRLCGHCNKILSADDKIEIVRDFPRCACGTLLTLVYLRHIVETYREFLARPS